VSAPRLDVEKNTVPHENTDGQHYRVSCTKDGSPVSIV
jgi:hypothetical protein